MRNRFALVVAPLLVTLISLHVSAADVAVVNGTEISQSFIDVLIAEQKAQGAADTPELRNAAREELIRRELLVQEAKKLGLDKRPEITAQAELARQTVFVRAVMLEFAKTHPVSDQELKSAYDNMKVQMGNTEYKVRHILMEQEGEAKAIIDNLKKGVKFDDLVKLSKDRNSRDRGGDLGWNNTAGMARPLGDAVVALGKGKYTEIPIRSNFGFHVILLDDSRPLTPPTLEQVRPQLVQALHQTQFQRFIGELRAKAQVR